ncbi:hypothetical protein [Tardiphaga sp.]|uniref:hypothetical protein n=1 Tax=Tardiphaga sp. TaxID=1926292 RepID=UPI00352AF97D
MQVERVLREYGHFLRPMSEAPRDGQRILGHSAQGGHLISCYWELHPQGLIGPNWVEERDSRIGYIDRYFDGWIRPSEFRLLDPIAINRLLVAYIDDARAADNREALAMLETGEGADIRPAALGQPMEDEKKSLGDHGKRKP